jgi:hypothetical protein
MWHATYHALDNFLIDKIVFREIELVGVLSAGWVSCELAIDLIEHAGAELVPCAHTVFRSKG